MLTFEKKKEKGEEERGGVASVHQVIGRETKGLWARGQNCIEEEGGNCPPVVFLGKVVLAPLKEGGEGACRPKYSSQGLARKIRNSLIRKKGRGRERRKYIPGISTSGALVWRAAPSRGKERETA